MLLGDVEQSRALVTVVPLGEAIGLEAEDGRLAAEKALLAALSDDEQTALDLLDVITSAYATSTILGWLAYRKGEVSEASRYWMSAWVEAGNDSEKIQAASALAPLGREMPDLSAMASEHPEVVEQIRSIHQVMSTPGDRLPVLRARSSQSEQLTVLLAEHLLGMGDEAGAAEVLHEGALRWRHPLMMRMAARHFFTVGQYERAQEACEAAIRLAGAGWSGTLDALEILFDTQEALERPDLSLLTAGQMVAIAPDSLGARWVLIQCLVRDGKLDEAWSALNYQGEPVAPRSAREARTWIGLLSRFDKSRLFIRRALGLFESWSSDKELQGVILLQVHSRPSKANIDEDEIAGLQRATRSFMAENPDNPAFRSVAIGSEEDPLEGLEALLKAYAPSPEMLDLLTRISKGELPVGLATGAFGRSYTECLVLRLSGLVYSDAAHLVPAGAIAVRQTRSGSRVVIDTSAAVTVAGLDESIAQIVFGSFAFLDTTMEAYRDALQAKEAFALRSGMSTRWDEKQGRIVTTITSDEEAARLVAEVDSVVRILGSARKSSRGTLRNFPNDQRFRGWLSALDFAIELKAPLWCDDIVLRQYAAVSGVDTFGTRDVLRLLVDDGTLSASLFTVIEASLITKYHVDMGFELGAMRLAASIDRWQPGGAAVNPSRSACWVHPDAALGFLYEAIEMNAVGDPAAVTGWMGWAGRGVVHLAGDRPDRAQGNLESLLGDALRRHLNEPALIPHLIAGCRSVLAEVPDLSDPLEGVLRTLHDEFVKRLGHASASAHLRRLVQCGDESDQLMAIRVILTTPA